MDSEEVRKQAEFDQLRQEALEGIPKTWWAMYENFQKEGFNNEQAWYLLTRFLDLSVASAENKRNEE